MQRKSELGGFSRLKRYDVFIGDFHFIAITRRSRREENHGTLTFCDIQTRVLPQQARTR